MANHPLFLSANEDEREKIERIKQFHKRKTISDTLRFLIETEHEKILSENKPTGIYRRAK